MNKKYTFKEMINDRYAVWYMNFPKRQGNKIGCYKIIDLYKNNRETRFAFRYRPRENQTQEQSDIAIIMNCIRNFHKHKPIFFSRGDHSYI